MNRNHLGLIAILAGLMAFAPMSIDMYLPALPELTRAFATDTARVQNTVASFFLGFAVGQAFYGPLTDRFGRKKPLFVTLTLFTLVSLGCIFAPDIDSFIILRFLQASAACAGVVIARAVVRDVFESHEAVKVLGALTLIFGLAPVLAPMIGGYLLLWFGWWAIFLALVLFGTLSLLCVIFFLPETHRPEHARPLALGSILATYGHLLGQRRFLGYALCGGFGSAGMFAYITGSPYVFMQVFGVLPQHYGWFFGSYTYTPVLGPRLGHVPVVIPMMWFALAYVGYVISNLIVWQDPADRPASLGHDAILALLGAMVVTCYDLGVDPYMVYVLKAWIMTEKDGWWFGETVQGFAGWMTVSFAILFAFRRLARVRTAPEAAGAVLPTMRHVFVPLGVYAGLMVFQVLLGYPVEARTIALFAMGFPLLAATIGVLRWQGVLARPAADERAPAVPADALKEAA